MFSKHIELYKPSYAIVKRMPNGLLQLYGGIYLSKAAAEKNLKEALSWYESPTDYAHQHGYECRMEELAKGYSKPFVVKLTVNIEEI